MATSAKCWKSDVLTEFLIFFLSHLAVCSQVEQKPVNNSQVILLGLIFFLAPVSKTAVLSATGSCKTISVVRQLLTGIPLPADTQEAPVVLPGDSVHAS